MRLTTRVLAAGAFIALAACSSFPVDTSASAASSKSMTVILSGFGTIGKKGWMAAEMSRGVATTEKLTLTFPRTDCDRDACARYQFFKKDGSQGFNASVPKGQAQAQIKLSDIVGHEGSLEYSDDGEYQVWSQQIFKAPDGFEYSMWARGALRVVVTKENFFDVACNDALIVWREQVGPNCEAQFTTSYRSVLCGAGCN